MHKEGKGTFLLILLLLFGLFFFDVGDKMRGIFAPAGNLLPEVEPLSEDADSEPLKEIGRTVKTPEEPLRTPSSYAEGEKLTAAGVIAETNKQRARYGLPVLAEDSRLSRAAEAKVEDMFENQYFAHIAPDETNVADLAASVGYEYVAVGENLALGGYESNADLVGAWMDSPGHRENILNGQYTEIGAAVGRGQYEGKETWLAVQEFGRPLSDCPEPEEGTRGRIDENQARLRSLEAELKREQEELDSYRPKSGRAYNEAVEEYNTLVNRYNILLSETKELIEAYNARVRLFNRCAEGAPA